MDFGKLKRRFYKYLPVIKKTASFLTACVLAYFLTLRLLPTGFRFFKSLAVKPVIFLSWLTRRQPNLRQTDDRANILLLGGGGGNHAAGDLTDSIILASINLKNGQTVFVSIPRDIWIESMKAKINTAYHYGEEKKEGGGLILAKATVSEILGLSVHYAVFIDFTGFIKAVDLVGGVDIEVERAFDDYRYPVPGMEKAEPEELRYDHLHFNQGWQHLDGETALKYVRSRYAEGEEGTDFSRSQRQQKMILALKDKIFSSKILLSPKKIKELSQVFSDYVDTDIQEREYPEFLKLALKFDHSKMKATSLDENLLFNPPQSQYDGQWVLVPKSGGWTEVQEDIRALMVSD